MKKAGYSVIIIIVLILGFFISIPVVNNVCADNVRKTLLEIPLPEQTEIVGSVSNAGKFVGNGNGMQYLGAILLKSQLNLEEVKKHYSLYGEHADECIVEEGTSISFDMLVVSFSVETKEDVQYYVVYSWGDGITPFSELDIRGH